MNPETINIHPHVVEKVRFIDEWSPTISFSSSIEYDDIDGKRRKGRVLIYASVEDSDTVQEAVRLVKWILEDIMDSEDFDRKMLAHQLGLDK
jgi:hypothetical protein